MNLPQQADPAAVARSRAQRVEIDLSMRGPTIHWLSSAVFWLLAGTVFALVSSHKLTNPEFVANAAWLTFGRFRAAHLNAVVYGWLSAGSISVGLWILARLCRAPLRHAGSLHVPPVLGDVGT